MARGLLLSLLVAGCATAPVTPPATCACPAAVSPPAPVRIVPAKDGGPTLLSPADVKALERYVRACSEGR